ncbi:MAG: 2-amino-4-hydroxy-6-hydroxymethyldihydropteridine diphosphokinase [Deltaproteobacteria bacterium]|nr:MAG: 2-amino-4-hydroxy-6-hydroxymethyldihydropteridine diphosphokinase [Deltaproteobacteria bacterium]
MDKDVYLSIGSNLGNPMDNIKKALENLRLEFGDLKVSSVYETEPQDYKEQNTFYNCCVYLKTSFGPFEILDKIQGIENHMGQYKKEIRFGPRLIDIDIIFYSDECINTDNLVIPHKRMYKRAFVLYPLAELNKDLFHPVIKKTVGELVGSEKIKEQGITKI